ncbi:MAG: methyltransferase domain-containing protein [Myxococcota bacterium]
MRLRLLDLVVCPRCAAGPFQLEKGQVEDDEIISGSLTCPGCATRFPIIDAVPRLLPDPASVTSDAQRTVDRFGAQWNDFDFIGDHYNQQFLGWIAPNTLESFEGQVVLEGGCGKGRHSALVARHGAKDVLAVDLGSAVEAAYRNTRGLKNCHVIQADLFHLPVAKHSVDTAFSVGVLHHTVDPEGAFRELVERVKPGGRMIAWVYGRENNGWIVNFVDPIRKQLTSRLPHRVIYELSRAPAALVYAASRGLYRPLSKGPLSPLGKQLFYHAYMTHLAAFPFDEVHSIVHDHLTPPIANYIPKDDFLGWFQRAGLEKVSVSWHNENSWRGTGYLRS